LAKKTADLDKSKAALAKVKLEEAKIEKQLADQVIEKKKTDK
jgi:hypothetical protein